VCPHEWPPSAAHVSIEGAPERCAEPLHLHETTGMESGWNGVTTQLSTRIERAADFNAHRETILIFCDHR
jgi:hypothetical protein